MSKLLESKIQYEHKIKLRGDEPVAVHVKKSKRNWKEIDSQIEVFLEKGYIEKSNSQYAAQIVALGKKDGSLRMCINYKGKIVKQWNVIIRSVVQRIYLKE